MSLTMHEACRAKAAATSRRVVHETAGALANADRISSNFVIPITIGIANAPIAATRPHRCQPVGVMVLV
jgi:hypothetical protein